MTPRRLILALFAALAATTVHAQTPAADPWPAVNTRLEAIEKALDRKKHKVLRPAKDIDFLYTAVTGNDAGCVAGTDEAHSAALTRCLSEVEGLVFKGAPPPAQSGELIERIGRVYTVLQHPDWDRDNIRIGGMIGRLPAAKGNFVGAAVHAYPFYVRNAGGLGEWYRGLSFLLGAGTVEDAGATAGTAYSLGLAVDVTRGFSVFVSEVNYRAQDASGATTRRAVGMVGVTLNSDLWYAMFPAAKN